jgi:hypothetical protein
MGLVACARVLLRDAKPVRWEMALPHGKNLGQLPRGHIFGYGVDSGMGCLIDGQAVISLREEDQRRLQDLRLTADTGCWRDLPLTGPEGLNAIAFSSGDGDGSYASYWGLAADGQPCWLVTDFELLVQPVSREFRLGRVVEIVNQHLQPAELVEYGVTCVTLQPGSNQGILPRSAGDIFEVVFEGENGEPSLRSGDKNISHSGSIQVAEATSIYKLILTETLAANAELVVRIPDGCRALSPL